MVSQAGDGSAVKHYRNGTHRVFHPDETIARVGPLMRSFGITRIANLTGLDRTGIPVVMVCRPNARSSAVFHGKGIHLAAAKASGLMEAVETWHAEHVHLPLRFGSAAELGASARLADLDGLPRDPADRFHPHLPMLWVEGDDWLGGGRVWLPYETVHANACPPEPPGSGCFAASTNGLASGNHRLEALSHGLCEVIERDATSLWHQLPASLRDATRLDLATVGDAACRGVLDRLAQAELDVGVWETTTDVGVPAFQCLVMDRTGEISHVGHGAGCHPARGIALLRALTEAVQVRMTYIVGSREDIEHGDYAAAKLQARTRQGRALLRPAARLRDFATIGDFIFEQYEPEIAWLLQRLHDAGIGQAVAVDLTRAEFGVAVVRVVVPGLEGSDHHGHYVAGRRALLRQGRMRDAARGATRGLRT